MSKFQMRVAEPPPKISGAKRSPLYQKAVDFARENPGQPCLVHEEQCQNGFARGKARNAWRAAMQLVPGISIRTCGVDPCGFQIYLTYTPPAEGK